MSTNLSSTFFLGQIPTQNVLIQINNYRNTQIKFSIISGKDIKKRRERDLNPRDLHRSQANKVHFPGLRPPRLGDPGICISRNKFDILTIKQNFVVVAYL